MFKWIIQKLIGTQNTRELKRIHPVVERINRLEPETKRLSDSELRAKTDELRLRFRESISSHKFPGPEDPEWYERNHDERAELRRQRRAIQSRVLDALLPEAFAVVREAGRRTLKMRHFDVQLVGGIVLHEGKIAEMATGEGKTLVATLAAYLNALTGRGVHIVTVNDYLARRDARWMGPIYHALGLSVGVIQGMDPAERRQEESLSFIYDPSLTQTSDRFMHLKPVSRAQAYTTDVLYGQNNEFGFDYLRDNMRFRLEELTQRDYHFAIVDEVDSILIDEARTPLIISGPAEESTELYHRLDRVAGQLKKDLHYEVDEKQHAIGLTEEGVRRCEELLNVDNMYDEGNMRLVHHVNQALRAHELFRRDVDYMIKDNEIVIVDEFTGRLMPGRRWSDGLHQAIEAKEGVRIREENQTLASVTFQNYFRMYEKLSGMTGTAATEAQEFFQIYKLPVVVIPTNQPLRRQGYPDAVYKTEDEKFIAVAQEIVEHHRRSRPVLIGTISIEKSERLSRILREPASFLERLGRVAQKTLEEMGKEKLSQELRAELQTLLSRPAGLKAAQIAEPLESLKREAPKSILTLRVEDMLRLVETIEAIRAGVPHNVLNAKYHENEARIVAQAGRKGAVTIATNMAGRGTDIVLGGNPSALAEDEIREEEKRTEVSLDEARRREITERCRRLSQMEHDEVVALGGLHIVGTERHEARRIDNQLRGRAGRQGDPGSSRFYLSFEDDLLRIFGSERISKLMEFKWFQWEEGVPIEHRMVSKSIESAQRRVEGHNFDIRKQLLEYDNTMNRQREVIYEQRRRILQGVDLEGLVKTIISEIAENWLDVYIPVQMRPDAWDLQGLRAAMQSQFAISLQDDAFKRSDGQPITEREAIYDQLVSAIQQAYEAKRRAIGADIFPNLEASIMLSIIDTKWKDHLYMMDALREGIHLRAYGQRDPVVEYQREAYRMFQDMIGVIKAQTLTMLLRVQPRAEIQTRSVFESTPHKEEHQELSTRLTERFPVRPPGSGAFADKAIPAGLAGQPPAQRAGRAAGTPVHRTGPKVGRNEPCPCGSGKKYKKCHGR